MIQGKLQFVLGISQKTRQQQNRFSRHRNSGILQQQHRRHGPVPVVHHRIPQKQYQECEWVIDVEMVAWPSMPSEARLPPNCAELVVLFEV